MVKINNRNTTIATALLTLAFTVAYIVGAVYADLENIEKRIANKEYRFHEGRIKRIGKTFQVTLQLDYLSLLFSVIGSLFLFGVTDQDLFIRRQRRVLILPYIIVHALNVLYRIIIFIIVLLAFGDKAYLVDIIIALWVAAILLKSFLTVLMLIHCRELFKKVPSDAEAVHITENKHKNNSDGVVPETPSTFFVHGRKDDVTTVQAVA